ncbi:MAG: MFS transporter [Bacillota bacterium]
MSAAEPSRKWLVLAVVGVGTFMSALDGSIVNISIPQIQAEYGVTIGTVGWVSTAYLLTISGLLLTFGRLGDMVGYKPVYNLGYIVFGLASWLCGVAPSFPALVGARVLQGVGAAMLMAIGPALTTTSVSPQERGRALGMVAAATYLGLTVGPSLGGYITDLWGWHWVFWINVPVAALGAALAAAVLPRGERRGGQRFDLVGAGLFALGLVSLLLALSRVEEAGWASPEQVGLFALAAGALVAFVWQEARAPQPVVPLGIFRNRLFASSFTAAYLQYVVNFMLVFLLPFYLLRFRGFAPRMAGLILTAQPLTMALTSPLAGALADRLGTRGLSVAGMLVMAAGIGLMGWIPESAPLGRIVAPLVLVGLGAGLFTTPNNSAIMGSVPRDRQGIAAGLLATARNVGMVTGVALAGALFAALQAAGLAAGRGSAEAFLAAFRGTERVAAALAVLAALAAAVRAEDRGSALPAGETAPGR